jgi:hypothetical protein
MRCRGALQGFHYQEARRLGVSRFSSIALLRVDLPRFSSILADENARRPCRRGFPSFRAL